jgi:hypothetical protein
MTTLENRALDECFNQLLSNTEGMGGLARLDDVRFVSDFLGVEDKDPSLDTQGTGTVVGNASDADAMTVKLATFDEELSEAMVRLSDAALDFFADDHLLDQQPQLTPAYWDEDGMSSYYGSVSPDTYVGTESPASVACQDPWVLHSFPLSAQTTQNVPRVHDVSHESVKRGKWTDEEDARLRAAVASYPGNWKKISLMVRDRTSQQCLHRWRKSVQPGINRSRWQTHEDDLLRSAVSACGLVWTKVQRLVPHRTDVQCRERWTNILDPAICKDSWESDEDAALRSLVAQVGAGKWSKIAERMPRRRTDYACRKRFEKLVRRSKAEMQC